MQLRTALLEAIEAEQEVCVQILISAKANVHAKTMAGDTALIVAARKGHPGILKTLMACGARIGERDAHGEDVIDIILSGYRNAPDLRNFQYLPKAHACAQPLSWGGPSTGDREAVNTLPERKSKGTSGFVTWSPSALDNSTTREVFNASKERSKTEQCHFEEGSVQDSFAERASKTPLVNDSGGRLRREGLVDRQGRRVSVLPVERIAGEEEGLKAKNVDDVRKMLQRRQAVEALHDWILERARTEEEPTVDGFVSGRIGNSPDGPWQGEQITDVVQGLAPRWDHLMQFEDTGIESMWLKLEVRDWDQLGEHPMVGSVVVRILDVQLGEKRMLYHSFDLTCTHSAKGALMLKLQFVGAQTLRVLVESGQDLVPINRREKKVHRILSASRADISLGALFDWCFVQISDCLEAAAKAGWDGVVRACIHERHGDPNRPKDERGILPLMYAAAAAQVSTDDHLGQAAHVNS